MLHFQPDQDITRAEADILVNTVNTVGVMGKGVALAMKKAFPQILEPYMARCADGSLQPGSFQMVRLEDGRAVMNLATKKHWRDPSRYAWIGVGMIYMNKLLTGDGPWAGRSLAMPLPGAGNGGLDPARVAQMARIYLAPAAARSELSILSREFGPIVDPVYYAGVGSRKTPEDVLALMQEVGARMSEAGYRLRSGGAIGADSAFHRGALEAGGTGEQIFLIRKRGDIPRGHVFDDDPLLERLALNFHPNANAIRPPDGDRTSKRAVALKLMSRNAYQVFGPDFSIPSSAVICWTPEGKGQGGTGQAIRLARAAEIPVIDLGCPKYRGIGSDGVVEIAREMILDFRLSRGLEAARGEPDCALC